MRKIIDANLFRNRELGEYLKSDFKNKAVFIDFACMEAYKGDAVVNIRKSFEIVSKFPDQVIVLKGTRDIVTLTLNNQLDSLVDAEQTKEFNIFYRGVQEAFRGNKVLANQVLVHGKNAAERFSKIRKESEKFVEGVELYTKSFKSEHLKALRNKENLDSEVIQKITHEMLRLAVAFFNLHPDIKEIPDVRKAKNCYIFRFAISAFLLGLHWIKQGGIRGVNKDKLLNDIVDMYYVAYSTYFDGLLTKDKKMIEIYEDTKFFLKCV